MTYNTSWNTLCPYLWNHYDDLYNSNINNNTQEWYNIIYTYDWTAEKIYNNGVLIAQQNIGLATVNSDGFMIWWRSWNNNLPWYISNLIVENVAWTAQEVENYYNATCEDYWLSPIS
jgi:hypothetical protein